MPRAYDAILLDLDGTLLNSAGQVHHRSVEALQAAREQGVQVTVVTGRSKVATLPILERLDMDTPAVIFNGAAVYCPRETRLLEERTLSNRSLDRALRYGEETDAMTLVMLAERKFALHPRSEKEERALKGLHGLEFVGREALRAEHTIRVTFLNDQVESSRVFADEVEAFVDQPLYLTHFPLSVLPTHRESNMSAVDVHPPCRGKAEALRMLEEQLGIPASRVVAVGDATNDTPMVVEAGLGVAVESGMRELIEVADRVIGGHDTDAVGRLVEELFL